MIANIRFQKVYDCPHLGDLLSLECSGELLWEQTEVKEMTLADIEKKIRLPNKKSLNSQN